MWKEDEAQGGTTIPTEMGGRRKRRSGLSAPGVDDAVAINCANPALPVLAGAEEPWMNRAGREQEAPRSQAAHPGWEQRFCSGEQGQHPAGPKSSKKSAQMSAQSVQAKLG